MIKTNVCTAAKQNHFVMVQPSTNNHEKAISELT